MAAVLPTSAKRTNKGRSCRAKAFIRNNNAAGRLTASWSVIEKQENERNVPDPEVCSGFSLRGRRVVEFRGGSRGRVLGVRTPSPPTEMTCGFLIQLVFCKKKTMWFINVEVEQETSAPSPKKNPGSAPGII